MSRLRFGVMNFCRSPYSDLSQRIRFAEEMGFDSAWVDDDILTPGYADFEAWTLLAALARDTQRIQLGTMVTVTAFRYPAVLAGQIITVDHVSNGRVVVGFGAGGPPNNYAALGLADWGPEERADRLEEQAVILAAMLAGKRADFEGKHYVLRGAQVAEPVRKPRPPLIVAAHGERGLRTVARYADGWNTLGGQAYPAAQDSSVRVPLATAAARTRRLSERLDEICANEGRDPATVQRSVLAYRPQIDPLSSLDAFDEYTGVYGEIGIGEIIFYWPPLDNLFPKREEPTNTRSGFSESRPLDANQIRAFERIATERIANRA